MYNLKIIFRRLLKDKTFSSLNIFGLVIGITSFLILFLYVSNEKSFDKHFDDHENIYRVTSVPVDQNNAPWARSLGIIHKASADFSEVELATQFTHCDIGTIKLNDKLLQQKNIMSVDCEFMEMFDVEAKVGNLSEIEKPNTVFITEDFAKKYFKGENPVGKYICIEALQYVRNLGDYEIKGIVKNTHPKTHFKYEMLISQNGGLQERFNQLLERKIYWAYNYFKVKKGTSPALLAEKLKSYYDASSFKKVRGPQEYNFSLVPMDDIHLKSDFRFELRESSNKINIGLFVLISFVVLLVSLLNFTNLTIAKLIKRSKELGLKKSIGANRAQLIKQVLGEVLLFCLFAIFISFIGIEILKPFINRFFEVEFEVYYTEPVVYLSILAVLFICLGLAAIFVVVFFLGRNTAIDILSKRNNYSGNLVLKTLLVIQICIVIILLSGTFLVSKQINFILGNPLGFDKENVVVLQLKDFSKDPVVFSNELKKLSQIKSVGFSFQYFGYPTQSLQLEDLGIDGRAELVFSNYDYLKTMNIELSKNWINLSDDTIQGLIINEHLYSRLMERHGSLEAFNTYWGSQESTGGSSLNLIGVAKDFNYNSAHQSIGDFAFILNEPRNRTWARFTHVRFVPGDLRATMSKIQEIWSDYYPEQEFNYFFMDEKIAQQYKAETILSRILFAFSSIGILISIIGISALALFISQQRTKEIGIRKVNGANVSEILALLNKGFIKWVTIAFIVACPIAWYAMNKWLENFAYKTTLSWWIFALAGVFALGIALLTVSWQSWRTATRNPVDALRNE